jgi:hypothetical protein
MGFTVSPMSKKNPVGLNISPSNFQRQLAAANAVPKSDTQLHIQRHLQSE